MSDTSVLVAMPCRDHVRTDAHIAQIAMCIEAKRFWNSVVGSDKFIIQGQAGVQAAEARSSIWKSAQSHNAEWILWVDDDVVPPMDGFEKLWEATPFADVVSGFYFKKGAPFESVIGRWPNNGGAIKWIDPSDMALPYEEVHVIGFGFCLMKRKVVDHVGSETNDLPFLTRPGNTEDNYFCTWVRRYGYRVAAVRDLICGHVGDYTFSYKDRQSYLKATAPQPSTA